MRIKEVVLDQETVKISALPWGKTKEYARQLSECRKEDGSVNDEKMTAASIEIVLDSVNRAGASPPLTKEIIEASWDAVFFFRVLAEVLKESGMAAAPGENKATSSTK